MRRHSAQRTKQGMTRLGKLLFKDVRRMLSRPRFVATSLLLTGKMRKSSRQKQLTHDHTLEFYKYVARIAVRRETAADKDSDCGLPKSLSTRRAYSDSPGNKQCEKYAKSSRDIDNALTNKPLFKNQSLPATHGSRTRRLAAARRLSLRFERASHQCRLTGSNRLVV